MKDVPDVSDEASLRKFLDTVAYKKEVIIWAFNANHGWIDFAVAMVEQLRGVGYQHFFALAAEPCCRALLAAVPDAACVTYRLPGAHWAVEDEKDSKHTSVQHIWIGRYKLANDVLRLGVNVLVADLDTIFRRDVYADFKSPPMDKASLIHMEEGFANGGLFYIQNPLPNGPTLWTHDEVSWWTRGRTQPRHSAFRPQRGRRSHASPACIKRAQSRFCAAVALLSCNLLSLSHTPHLFTAPAITCTH